MMSRHSQPHHQMECWKSLLNVSLMPKCMGGNSVESSVYCCLFFYPLISIKLNPFFFKMPVCRNGAPIPVEMSCRYLRHIIELFECQCRYTHRQLIFFLRKAKHAVTYCGNLFICYEITFVYVPLWSLYTSTIWCECTKTVLSSGSGL